MGDTAVLGVDRPCGVDRIKQKRSAAFPAHMGNFGISFKEQGDQAVPADPQGHGPGVQFSQRGAACGSCHPLFAGCPGEDRGIRSIWGPLYDTSIIYLIRLPHRVLTLESTLPGRRIPAFCGGRAFLSCLNDSEVRAIPRTFGPQRHHPPYHYRY